MMEYRAVTNILGADYKNPHSSVFLQMRGNLLREALMMALESARQLGLELR